MSTLPLSAAEKIALYQRLPPKGLPNEISQATHRINLVNSWSVITPGTRILEIGCGQGNSTAVLAEAVGPSGHIDAIDPAPPTYGAPITLAEAQAHISASAVGERVSWHRAAPVEFLSTSDREGKWDVAVLAHCIWYFSSPQTLVEIFTALKGRVEKVCLAEYALSAAEATAVPHVLAALARGTLEAHKKVSGENIQNLLSPQGIVDAAKRAGWTLGGEGEIVVPGEGLLDGRWETGSVASEGFLREIEDEVEDERVRIVLRSARDSVLAAVQRIGGVKAVRTMDVWAGVFTVI